MPIPPPNVLSAAQKYGPLIDHVAAKYTNPYTGHPLTGTQLLLKLAHGENGWGDTGVSSVGARGYTQFMPGTRQDYISKYGIDPWKNADSAFHATAIYLRNSGNVASYNPGMPTYTQYVLGQKIGGGYGAPVRSTRPTTPAGPAASPSVPSTGTSTGSTGPVDPSALAALLGGQSGPQPVQASAPYPTGQGADRYLRAPGPFMWGSGGPQPQQSGVSAQLAALGATGVTVPGVSGAGAAGPSSPTTPRTRVGRTLVVGDSLGVGTLGPLKQLLGNTVTGNASVGRPSTNGVQVLGNLVKGDQYQNVVFDLGTNDPSAQVLHQNLTKALALAPNAQFYVPTLNGPGAQQKNLVLHQIAQANPNVHLVPWHTASQGLLGGDGIHATGSGYQTRAQLLAKALGYQPQKPTAPVAGGDRGFAGGFLPHTQPYKPGRADQGRDGQTTPGGAIIAPGAGRVVSVLSDPNGFGPAYPVVQFTSGPYKGKTIYLGHTLTALQPGATFKQGAVLSRTGTHPIGNAQVPGWFEIGYAPGGSPGRFGQPTPFR